MKNETLPIIIELIWKKDYQTALKSLTQLVSKDCIPLIKAKHKNFSRQEVFGAFYYAFLDLCDSLHSGKFQFQGDASFVSYFKTTCVHQAHKISREQNSKEFILPVEIIEIIEKEAVQTRQEVCSDFIQEKMNRYNIHLDIPDSEVEDSDHIIQVVKSFHLLSDKCKFLIVLKFFLKLSHKEISESLNLFYEINSPDVSKTELSRCIGSIKKMITKEVYN